MRILRNIWLWILEQVDAIPLFFLHLYKEIAALKWYEVLPILILLLRIIRWDGDDVTVPIFAEVDIRYTYHVFWHWFCTSVFETSILYCLYRQRSLLLFLGLVYIGYGDVIDEFSLAAIDWCAGKRMWIGCTVIILYIIWKKNPNNGKST